MKSQRTRKEARGKPVPVLRVDDESVKMALQAAEMVTWQWNVREGTIQYSDNVPEVTRGKDVAPYDTVENLFQAVHPGDRARLKEAVDRARTGKHPFECEYRVRFQDGRYHWVLGKGRPGQWLRGKPARLLGVSQDITARKRTEEMLKKRSQQLAELASRLILAEHEERMRLAALLHDDLQQHLVGARMQVHAMADTKGGASRRQFERLQKILGETLDMSRSITKDLAPPVVPQKHLDAALQWLARDMLRRHRLEVKVDVSPVCAAMDDARAILLFTAAKELLLNVVKHAGVGRARLYLRCDAAQVELEVADRGAGFDAGDTDAFQSDSGFGLLSIRERAELLGGRLAVKTAPGKGTRMVLSLPLVRSLETGERRAAGSRR